MLGIAFTIIISKQTNIVHENSIKVCTLSFLLLRYIKNTKLGFNHNDFKKLGPLFLQVLFKILDLIIWALLKLPFIVVMGARMFTCL